MVRSWADEELAKVSQRAAMSASPDPPTGENRQREHAQMADDLTTACIAAVAAIVGGLVTGAYGHAVDYFRLPKLKIDYDQDAAASKVTIKYKQQEINVE
jgi:hypothetical protein